MPATAITSSIPGRCPACGSHRLKPIGTALAKCPRCLRVLEPADNRDRWRCSGRVVTAAMLKAKRGGSDDGGRPTEPLAG